MGDLTSQRRVAESTTPNPIQTTTPSGTQRQYPVSKDSRMSESQKESCTASNFNPIRFSPEPRTNCRESSIVTIGTASYRASIWQVTPITHGSSASFASNTCAGRFTVQLILTGLLRFIWHL